VSRSLVTHAPAKINLTLHVLGRRTDGYHALESLVAFAGFGDGLSLEPGPDLALWVEGPTATPAGVGPDNLVLRAARLLVERIQGLRLGRFRLIKRLPVAAGLGGGSSDAAAALRLLARHNDLSLHDPALREAARLAGADVPVCLEPRARMMRGIGDDLGPALELPRLFGVLVNPRVAIETPTVFRELGLEPGSRLDGPSHPAIASGSDARSLIETLGQARNDLEGPALRLQPAIGDALAALRRTPGCCLVRMSGSGATVCGIYESRTVADQAMGLVRRARPGWWVRATGLR